MVLLCYLKMVYRNFVCIYCIVIFAMQFDIVTVNYVSASIICFATFVYFCALLYFSHWFLGKMDWCSHLLKLLVKIIYRLNFIVCCPLISGGLMIILMCLFVLLPRNWEILSFSMVLCHQLKGQQTVILYCNSELCFGLKVV